MYQEVIHDMSGVQRTLDRLHYTQNKSDSWEINHGGKSGAITINTERGIYKFKVHLCCRGESMEAYIGDEELLSIDTSIEGVLSRITGKVGYIVRNEYETLGNNNTQTPTKLLDMISGSIVRKKYDSEIEGQEPDLKFGNLEVIQKSQYAADIMVILEGEKKLLGQLSYSPIHGKGKVAKHRFIFQSKDPRVKNENIIESDPMEASNTIMAAIYDSLSEISPKEFPPEETQKESQDSVTHRDGNYEGVDYVLFIDKENSKVELHFTLDGKEYKLDIGRVKMGAYSLYVRSKSDQKPVQTKVKNRLSGKHRDQDQALKKLFVSIYRILKSTSPNSKLFRDELHSFAV